MEHQNRYSALEQSAALRKLSTQMNDLVLKTRALSIHPDATTEGCSSTPHDPLCAYNLRSCHVDIDALRDILSRLRAVENDLKVTSMANHILNSLNFEKRTSRHEAIHDAHKATFEWVFSDHMPPHPPGMRTDLSFSTTHPERAHGSFKTWLESRDKIFWISGKPGSGKSALMKFIANHDRTRACLKKKWGAQRVVIASYYFWSAGTPMQKSFKGLL